LLAGVEGMQQRRAKLPAAGRARQAEAVGHLIKLYEATGRPAEAARWRRETEAVAVPAGEGENP
jgi:hypothetical protein